MTDLIKYDDATMEIIENNRLTLISEAMIELYGIKPSYQIKITVTTSLNNKPINVVDKSMSNGLLSSIIASLAKRELDRKLYKEASNGFQAMYPHDWLLVKVEELCILVS